MSDEPMDPVEYLEWWPRISPLATLAAEVPVEKMLQHITHMHTISPLLDPTAYRDGVDNLEEQAALLRGLAPFVGAARKLQAKAKRRRDAIAEAAAADARRELVERAERGEP